MNNSRISVANEEDNFSLQTAEPQKLSSGISSTVTRPWVCINGVKEHV